MFQHCLHPIFRLDLGFFFMILVHREFQTYAQPISEQNRSSSLEFPAKLRYKSQLLLCSALYTQFSSVLFPLLWLEHKNTDFQFCSTYPLFLLLFRCHSWPLISTVCSPALHVQYLTTRVWGRTQKFKEKISHFSVQISLTIALCHWRVQISPQWDLCLLKPRTGSLAECSLLFRVSAVAQESKMSAHWEKT